MELENPETVRHLVTAGLGLSICSVSSLGGERRALAIIELAPPLHRQLGVVRRKDKRVGAALGAVLAILEDLRRGIEEHPRRGGRAASRRSVVEHGAMRLAHILRHPRAR